MDSFLFYGENNSKTFENYYVIRAESPPLNPSKCHLLLSGKKDRATNVRKLVIKNSRNERLLRVLFEGNASFEYRIQNTCIKTSKKHEFIKNNISEECSFKFSV